MKSKKIFLEYAAKAYPSPYYLVRRVENSTEFNPDDVFEKEKVDDLIARTNWQVIIIGLRK